MQTFLADPLDSTFLYLLNLKCSMLYNWKYRQRIQNSKETRAKFAKLNWWNISGSFVSLLLLLLFIIIYYYINFQFPRKEAKYSKKKQNKAKQISSDTLHIQQLRRTPYINIQHVHCTLYSTYKMEKEKKSATLQPCTVFSRLLSVWPTSPSLLFHKKKILHAGPIFVGQRVM